MTLTLWLLTALAAALALGGGLLLGRSLMGQRGAGSPSAQPISGLSVPGMVAEALSVGLLIWLVVLGAPLYALLVVLVAGMVGTGLTLLRVLGR